MESEEDATSEVFLKLQRSGEGLGWSLPGAEASEALGSHEGRLDARTLIGPLDPHYRWVHPVSRRVGPPGCGLPGLGSFCRPALSEFPTGINGMKGVGSASSLHRSNELRKPTLRSSVDAAELAGAKTADLLRGASSQQRMATRSAQPQRPQRALDRKRERCRVASNLTKTEVRQGSRSMPERRSCCQLPRSESQ